MSKETKLLVASTLTIVVAGVGFGVRGGLMGEWATEFGFTKTELGTITGGGFTGFGAVILIASLFLDRFGYKPFLLLAGVLHVVSVIITVYATVAFNAAGDPESAKAAAYWYLFVGIFIFAIANGICEAVINPLVATLYKDNKTHFLNILHSGWPLGIVLGTLLGIVLIGSVRWEIVLALYLIPTLVYIVMIAPVKFPKSEAQEAGLDFRHMLAEFAAPMLLFLLLLHVCVGYVELGTDSWIANIMNNTLPGYGLAILLYTSALMFVLRFFAGPIVHRINPLGLLFASAVLAVIGLMCLGTFTTGMTILVAATIYGLGKTFFWPTMLGVVSERYPRGGALTLGAIGGVGMLSAGLLGGPGVGYTQDVQAAKQLSALAPAVYEEYKSEGANQFLFFSPVQGLDGSKVGPILEASAAGETLTEEQEQVQDANLYGGRRALVITAGVPAFMALGYLILILYFKSQGGYKVVRIGEEPAAPDEY
jgi:MFS family permease